MPLSLSGASLGRMGFSLPFCSLSFLLKFDISVSSTEPDIQCVFI